MSKVNGVLTSARRWGLFLMLVLLISFSNAFAVRDLIIRHPEHKTSTRSVSEVENSNYPYPKDKEKVEEDEYNCFVYTDHFRVIVGKSYKDFVSVKNLMSFISSVVETVWKKEINDLGFKSPKNSDKYYIDIYIGNKRAFNPVEGDRVNISSSYAGFATAYPDGTPYFIVNPDVPGDILKVTLAHEFFHTVQFSYYDFLSLDDELFYKNLWWLEATAVWMESVVFPEVKDYENFINDWIRTCYYDINTANGEHEYGESVVPVYLYLENATQTVKLVKESLKEFPTYEDFVSFLDENVGKFFKETSLSEVITDIASCIDRKACFKDADKFVSFPEFYEDSLDFSGYYSLFPVSFDCGKNLYVESPLIAGKFEEGKGKVFIVSKVPKEQNLSDKDLPVESLFSFAENGTFSFSKGWNLFSNPANRKVKFEKLFPANFDYLIWDYSNGTWRAWSNRKDLNDLLERFGFLSNSTELEPNEGIWIRVWKNVGFEPVERKLVCRRFNGNTAKWKLVSFGIPLISASDLKSLVGGKFLMWSYENGRWEFYSSVESLVDAARNYGLNIIKKIGREKSYWFKKIK